MRRRPNGWTTGARRIPLDFPSSRRIFRQSASGFEPRGLTVSRTPRVEGKSRLCHALTSLGLAFAAKLPSGPGAATLPAKCAVPVTAVVEIAAKPEPALRCLLRKGTATDNAGDYRAAAAGGIINESGSLGATRAAVDQLRVCADHVPVA